jgi:hypothetical protein
MGLLQQLGMLWPSPRCFFESFYRMTTFTSSHVPTAKAT